MRFIKCDDRPPNEWAGKIIQHKGLTYIARIQEAPKDHIKVMSAFGPTTVPLNESEWLDKDYAPEV